MNSEQNNTILVTGGRGFIGRAVVKLLLRSGYPVISLDRSAMTNEADAEGCREVQCDLADVTEVQRVFQKQRIAGIIHLAAILPTAAQRNPFQATQVNVMGSLNLVERAREHGITRFVFGSSLSVYGTYPAGRVVSELDRAAPEDLYGAAKLYVEQLGEAYRDCHRLQFVGLRIGRVVGPGAHSRSSAWRSEIFELLKVNYPAEISLPYRASEKLLVIHVDDLAAMLLSLWRAPTIAHAVYNAPCRSILVADLKRVVEDLNSNLTVRIGEGIPAGNPQDLDSSRFQSEFGFETASIFDRLRKAAGK